MIHPMAHIGDDVEIGARTRVWQFASIIRKARIGEDCNIGGCAIVDGSTIGDRCIIGHGGFISPGMSIGDDVFIGPNCLLCNDFWPRPLKDGWFDINDLISGKIIVSKVGSRTSLGANSVILPGVRIGEGVMVAAGAVVHRNVLPHHLFTREGTMVAIDPHRSVNRMRHVG